MPRAGDGFTLVSAMRHTHPDALTVVLSGYPALDEAMSAILAQADEIFAKPIRIGELKELIRTRLAHSSHVGKCLVCSARRKSCTQQWLKASFFSNRNPIRLR
jgi:ActR/RegA family two-component response regulator